MPKKGKPWVYSCHALSHVYGVLEIIPAVNLDSEKKAVSDKAK
jgi:hypothetical protein